MKSVTRNACCLPLLSLMFAGMTLAADLPATATPASPASSQTPASGSAQPRSGALTLDSTAIRGNQELPKVLYIVPWKNPAAVELSGRPVNSLIEEILTPVDREVFRRQTRYFSQLYGAGSAAQQTGRPGGHPVAADTGETARLQAVAPAASSQQD